MFVTNISKLLKKMPCQTFRKGLLLFFGVEIIEVSVGEVCGKMYSSSKNVGLFP